MNRIMGFIIGAILVVVTGAAAQNEPAQASSKTPGADDMGQESVLPAAAGKKKIYIQVGAIEKSDNSKYLMRKIDTRYEFYLNDSARIFLRSEAAIQDIQDKAYIIVKGPKNKKVVLANAIYMYANRSDYDDSIDKKDDNEDAAQKVFSVPLQGFVKQKDPLVMTLSDGRDYTVSYDDDTYLVMTKKCDKSELKPGERVKLYFDKLYSIRYDNYPIKIVIDRVKSGY
jgi:hypothetical protein